MYHIQLSMMLSFDVIAFIVQHVMTQNPACSSHRQCSVAPGFFCICCALVCLGPAPSMPTYSCWTVECPLGCGKAFKAWESEATCMQRLTTHLMNSSNHMDLVSRTQLPSVQIDAVDRLHYVVSCVFRLCTLEVVCKHSG